jgi:putative methyltransferase (TIGR04325 family)
MKKILHTLKKILKSVILKPLYGNSVWTGQYDSWADVLKKTSSYQADTIFDKVKGAAQAVLNGEALYERDAVLFHEPDFDWALLAVLQQIAISNNNKLALIDFGGSLGSTYFQNRHFLPTIDISWNVVEQNKFVEMGDEMKMPYALSFHLTIQDALSKSNAKVLLLSSMLQYVEDPYKLLEEMIAYDFEYVILARTSFIKDSQQRLTLQNVPSHIYSASYPCWFFNEEEFIQFFSKKYSLKCHIPTTVENEIQFEDAKSGYWKGFYFKKK